MPRNPRPLGLLSAAFLALVLSSCGGEPTGSAAAASGSVNFTLLFQTTGGTSVIRDSVSSVRLIVTRISPAPVAVISDAVQSLATHSGNNGSGDGPDSVTAAFPLQGADAQYQIVLKAFNPGSDTLYQIGPLGFSGSQVNASGGVHLEVPQSGIVYIGPGADAVRVVASPRSANLLPGQQFQFTAQALGANGSPVPRALFKWSVVSGTDVAGVDDNGMASALGKRGTAVIAVGIPSTNAPSDTVIVNVSLGAAQLVLVSGGNQTAPAGAALANPIVVRVVAQDGVPVPGVVVTFGAGASPATATSDANGLVQTRWTLSNAGGAQSLNVSAPNVPPLTVQATASQAGLTLISGGNQSALAGHQLAQPVVVQVANGTTPVSGVNVVFSVAAGNGSVSPVTVATDANGRAQTTWTMGATAGTETMSVTAAGAGGTVTVTATATVAPTIAFVSVLPTAITTAGNAAIVAIVTGTNGQPQGGAQVTFSSSGSANTFNPVTATTDTTGHATTLFSSSVAETKTITATANGVSAQVSVPVVSASNAAMSIVKVSGDNQSVHYGTSFAQPLVVQALNANGSPVAGALIDWGTSAGNLRKVTDANGMSSNTYQLANDPVHFPTGVALPITVSLVGTAAVVIFTYFAIP